MTSLVGTRAAGGPSPCSPILMSCERPGRSPTRRGRPAYRLAKDERPYAPILGVADMGWSLARAQIDMVERQLTPVQIQPSGHRHGTPPVAVRTRAARRFHLGDVP